MIENVAVVAAVALNEVRLFNGQPHRVWFNNPEPRNAQWLVAPNGVMRMVAVEEIAALPFADEAGAFIAADPIK